jgi:hypothetical protein
MNTKEANSYKNLEKNSLPYLRLSTVLVNKEKSELVGLIVMIIVLTYVHMKYQSVEKEKKKKKKEWDLRVRS